MKKIYIAPNVRPLVVDEENIIASSPGFDSDGTVIDDESGIEELSREHRGNNRNTSIWDQGW